MFNVAQFNGEYGCIKCIHEGFFLGDKKKRVYPHEDSVVRTNDMYKRQAKKAKLQKTREQGNYLPTLLKHFKIDLQNFLIK